MATTLANAHNDVATPPRRNIVMDVFHAIGRGLMHLTESNQRVRELEWLQTLSDAQLKARGLRRDQLAHYVFRDILYI